jgi:metal-responsive CopG/Arc/MetJ family transcriptional regulator
MTDRKVKTTIDMPEDLWKQFSIKVIQEHGGRKKNDVIEELVRKYLRESEKGERSSK